MHENIKIHTHALIDMSSSMHTHSHSGEEREKLSEIQNEIDFYLCQILIFELFYLLSVLFLGVLKKEAPITRP